MKKQLLGILFLSLTALGLLLILASCSRDSVEPADDLIGSTWSVPLFSTSSGQTVYKVLNFKSGNVLKINTLIDKKEQYLELTEISYSRDGDHFWVITPDIKRLDGYLKGNEIEFNGETFKKER